MRERRLQLLLKNSVAFYSVEANEFCFSSVHVNDDEQGDTGPSEALKYLSGCSDLRFPVRGSEFSFRGDLILAKYTGS